MSGNTSTTHDKLKTNQNTRNILVVDDELEADQITKKDWQEGLGEEGFNTFFARDAEVALDFISSHYSDLIVLDIVLPKVDGQDFDGKKLLKILKQKILKENLTSRIIVISAYAFYEELQDLIDGNIALQFISKNDFDLETFLKLANSIVSYNSSYSAQLFDYSHLDRETSRFIQQQTGEIRTLMKRTAQNIIEVGQKLIKVKEKLERGQFGSWLKAEFDWTERTAQRFMSVAEHFSNHSDIMSDVYFAPTALYLLAANSTPEAVREEAVTRARAGESITHKTAQKIKQRHTKSLTQPKPDIAEPEPLAKEEEGKAEDKESEKFLSPSSPQRQEAVEPPRQNLEIRSLIPRKEAAPASVQTFLTESWWQLGEQHLLYCGYPDSPNFRERLPKEVALTLAFPPSPQWQVDVPCEPDSALVFFYRHPTQDVMAFRELIGDSLELYTNDGETVVFSFLPDPELLSLANVLGCRCFIAEPDAGRCEAAIAAWKERVGDSVQAL